MAVLSIGNDGNFERFLTSSMSQTTKPCCCIITLRYALLQGYMRVGYSPLYIIMNSCAYLLSTCTIVTEQHTILNSIHENLSKPAKLQFILQFTWYSYDSKMSAMHIKLYTYELSDRMMPSDKCNSITAKLWPWFLHSSTRCFVPRRAFSPTAAAPMLASWFYQSLPLFSFVLHYFLHYRIGNNLQYSGFHGRLKIACCFAWVKCTVYLGKTSFWRIR